jgi:hypothetical protein
MPRDRKFLRDQIRKNIKKAKKEIPSEYRDSISFGDVYRIMRDPSPKPLRGASSSYVGIDDVGDFSNKEHVSARVENEAESTQSTADA